MRKKTFLFVIIALLVSLSMAATGCSHENEKANKLVDKANKSITKANSLEKEIQNKFEEMESLPDSDEEFKDSLGFSKEIKETIKEEEKEMQKSIAAFEEAKDLNVSDEYKKYLDLEIKASKAQINNVKQMGKLAQIFIDLFDKGVKGKVTDKDIEDFGNEAEQLINKGEKLEKEVEQLNQTADDYYKKEELGN